MAGYSTIQGPLSFQGGGGDYKSAYASALAMNQQNYGNILAGYQNTLINQQNAQGRIIVGHQNLEANVLGSIAGIDRSQRQDIADQYAKNIGMASQDLINRGLGNSTVQSSVGRGLLYDKAKSDIALTNSTQGLNAQYMSQLGLARLGYESQAAQQNTAWAGKQLDWMNSVNAAYPDPRTYAMLAQMKGQAGGGGGVGSGATTYGGSVKSPLGGGGGYPGAPINGSAGFGGSYGAAKLSSNPYSGAPQTLDMSGYGSPSYDLHSTGGMWQYAENANELPGGQEEGFWGGGGGWMDKPGNTEMGLDENGDPIDTSGWY